jgi:hypothetical protein
MQLASIQVVDGHNGKHTHITTHGREYNDFDHLLFCWLEKAQYLLDFRLCAGLDWYYLVCDTASTHLSGNGDLNLNTGLDVDDDLLDNLGGGVKARRG